LANSPLGIDVTLVTSTAKHELGLKVYDPANPQNRYQYVRADDAITQYQAVGLDFAAGGSGSATDVPNLVTPTSAVNESIEGIAQVAFSAGYYGFILIEGTGTCLTAAAIASAGIHLVSTATAGTLDDTAAAAANALAQAGGRGVIAVTAAGTSDTVRIA
jgi:hypothetical protein